MRDNWILFITKTTALLIFAFFSFLFGPFTWLSIHRRTPHAAFSVVGLTVITVRNWTTQIHFCSHTQTPTQKWQWKTKKKVDPTNANGQAILAEKDFEVLAGAMQHTARSYWKQAKMCAAWKLGLSCQQLGIYKVRYGIWLGGWVIVVLQSYNKLCSCIHVDNCCCYPVCEVMQFVRT